MAKHKDDRPDDKGDEQAPPPPAKLEANPPAACPCEPSDRAAGHPGQRRFKLRAKAEGASTRYVLAPDRAAAEACYRGLEPAAVAGVTVVITDLPD